MNIIEINEESNYGYREFFTEGLARHGDCFKMYPEEQLREAFPTKGTPSNFTIAAIDEHKKLMGVVSFQRVAEGRAKLAHKGYLFKMYVSSENGGKQLGRKLLEHVIDRVKQELPDIEQITLNVATKNEKAKQLYSKLGFVHFGTERNAFKVDGVYYDDDYMALDLKNAL